MSGRNSRLALGWWLGLGLWVWAGSLHGAPAWAAEEVTSYLSRYRQHEASTGIYEQYEVRPRRLTPYVAPPDRSRRSTLATNSSAAKTRLRGRLADSHQGLPYYERRTCLECHPGFDRNLHSIRAGITCRQCHGQEPIAASEHYYAPMNPIRRHAYVCAKCHPGADASFATYVIHEPGPGTLEASKSFPLLFWAFWAMIIVALGTFLVFLPHTALWGLREFLNRRRRP